MALANRSDSAWSPRLSAIVHLSDRLALTGSAYRAFRAPTLNELIRNFRVGNVLTLANDQLGPERVSAVEAGARSGPFRATLFSMTTTDTIANGLLALLQNPDQLEKLRTRPGLVAGAVEELMRYDGAVQLRGVRSTRELEIGGALIGAEQTVFMVIGAANRDLAQFPEPDRVDIERSPNRHLEFGHGIHFCLGAALARAESQIAINSLLARRPRLALASEDLEWKSIPVFRGLKSLPVCI